MFDFSKLFNKDIYLIFKINVCLYKVHGSGSVADWFLGYALTRVLRGNLGFLELLFQLLSTDYFKFEIIH